MLSNKRTEKAHLVTITLCRRSNNGKKFRFHERKGNGSSSHGEQNKISKKQSTYFFCKRKAHFKANCYKFKEK